MHAGAGLGNSAPEKVCDISGIEKDAPILCGVAQQGGMIYGQADDWDVFAGDARISNDGVFVIGLGRDASDTLKLKFCKNKNCQTYAYPIMQRKYQEQKVNVPDKFVKYPPEIEKRTEREAAAVKAARAGAGKDAMLYFMEFSLPENLKKFEISGIYGSRRVFNGEPKSPHNGLDFAAPAGTPVYSIASGSVILAEEHYMNGNIVLVSHGHGVVSAYLHLSEISAKVGDKVDIAKIIGKVGNTGRASGAHLHLGLYHNQTAIDPGLFIKK